MTAWDILYANSTLNSGVAWDHLNNQQGGGGFEQLFMTPVDHFRVNMEEKRIGITFNQLDLSVEYPTYVSESSGGNLDLKLEFNK